MFLKCELFNIYLNNWAHNIGLWFLHNVIIRVQIMVHHLIDYKQVYFWTLYLPPFLQSYSNNFYFYFIEMWWSYDTFTFDFRRGSGLYFIVLHLKIPNSTNPLFQVYPYSLSPFWLNICLICIWFWRRIVLFFFFVCFFFKLNTVT